MLAPQDLAGERVLVTAGPTEEPIDPVRYLSNRSSGKMGYAIARVARRRGAEVTLVSGPTALAPPPGVRVVRVDAARARWQRRSTRRSRRATVVVMAAAVADYRPRRRAGAEDQEGRRRRSRSSSSATRTSSRARGRARAAACSSASPPRRSDVVAEARRKLRASAST